MVKGKVISLNPTSSMYFKIGIKHYEKGEVELAIKRLMKALELDNKNVEIKFNLAGLLAQVGDFETSNKLLSELTKDSPEFYDSLFGLGCNFFEMGKFKEAKNFLKRYVKLSNNIEFKEAAEDLIDFIESQEEFEKEQKEIEKYSKLLERGNFLLESGRYEDAMKYFKMILAKDDSVLAARNNLSLAYFYMGDIQKAIEEAKKVLQIDKYNVYANCNLAFFYSSIGKEREMKRHLKVVLDIKTYDSKDKIKILDTLIKLNQHSEIAQRANELFEITREPYFKHIEAVSLYNTRKYMKAKKIWEFLKKNFEMPEIRIDYFLKKVDNVIKTFEKDTIDYFETGFKFLEGMDEKEFRRQLQSHIDNYFSKTVEENGQKVMEILHKHVELNQKDQEAIFNLLKSLPLEKPRLNLQAIAAIVWYVFKKYMKREKIKQKDVAKIFGISQAVFSKWFGDFKELLLNKEV
ncbi:tetratricopeptide repeat protein [Caldicellulosiruptor acetigenus]|uniref:Tetratricopeptide TPR_2 repeat-containing protein n=1 Tax=Caldicellulosiruptor acetigenus 6A TaxID=632516 RepID=G2PXT8_9FIRM|nr:tetratricopeptide repeat protein [Caldicellulosiruptor acetigenus]AEM73934.1 Tetratricopeptide TPR_2 repeat-containing protein [Caldicellulosiruptor acetigenus 6A]